MKTNEGLTTFGKTLRKIRIDHDLTLGKLADQVGVSAAFVSALERGKPVPPDFVEKVGRQMHLGATDISALHDAAALQQKEVKLSMTDRSDQARMAAVAFARRFETMSDKELADLLNAINSR
ncbi:helix-turn-helix transcriptional regulator [Lysobacter sp. M2-1]|uniref:helix-turn-helix domain-containing protein n=1 Tax=Lysobacter sp. M2-1 TaxID=2916839 RepID=UPI001F579FDE|nr:helix-turn-helix transcriptional regulator [Lysobacter sp. M2-1]